MILEMKTFSSYPLIPSQLPLHMIYDYWRVYDIGDSMPVYLHFHNGNDWFRSSELIPFRDYKIAWEKAKSMTNTHSKRVIELMVRGCHLPFYLVEDLQNNCYVDSFGDTRLVNHYQGHQWHQKFIYEAHTKEGFVAEINNITLIPNQKCAEYYVQNLNNKYPNFSRHRWVASFNPNGNGASPLHFVEIQPSNRFEIVPVRQKLSIIETEYQDHGYLIVDREEVVFVGLNCDVRKLSDFTFRKMSLEPDKPLTNLMQEATKLATSLESKQNEHPTLRRNRVVEKAWDRVRRRIEKLSKSEEL